MATIIVSNAFSINMLPEWRWEPDYIEEDEDLEEHSYLTTPVVIQPITLEQARAIANSNSLISAVGHEPTAQLFSSLLGRRIQYRRAHLELGPGEDVMLVGQYRGPRLEEGATELPEGAKIRWALVCMADFVEDVEAISADLDEIICEAEGTGE